MIDSWLIMVTSGLCMSSTLPRLPNFDNHTETLSWTAIKLSTK